MTPATPFDLNFRDESSVTLFDVQDVAASTRQRVRGRRLLYDTSNDDACSDDACSVI